MLLDADSGVHDPGVIILGLMAMSANLSLVRQRIATRLHDLFDDLIDLSDVQAKPDADKENVFITRSLSALFLLHEAGLEAAVAARCVTDGSLDDGIDAIHVDEKRKIIYFVQSKWKTGSKGVQLNEFTRFRDGFLKVLSFKWDNENKNLHRFKDNIEKALKDIDTTIVLAFTHTCDQKISENIKVKISDFVVEQNKYSSDFVEFREFDLTDTTNAARSWTRPAEINLSVMLQGWGLRTKPYRAVYGSVSGSDVASWYKNHGTKLFVENLRYVLDKSEINEGIAETALKEPQNFWYFNNGITAICDTFEKQPLGGNSTETGVFDVKKISIINGAQTVGTLGRCLEADSKLDDVVVNMRIISLENTEEGFSSSITRNNNTQNDLSAIDFVSFDPNQERIRRDAAQFAVVYSYRRGEPEPDPSKGFTVRDATIAAACASGDLRLAVSSKRYISGLWGDIKKEPYIKLFNDRTGAHYLWNLVRIMRWVDEILNREADKLTGKERLVAVHGNRFILYKIFSGMSIDILMQKDLREIPDMTGIERSVIDVLSIVKALVSTKFPESYPGNIFKNQDRQQELIDSI